MNSSKVRENLVSNILTSKHCTISSDVESEGIVDAVFDSMTSLLGDMDDGTTTNKDEIKIKVIRDFLIESILDYIPDLSREECIVIVENTMKCLTKDDKEEEIVVLSESSSGDDESDNDYADDDDKNYIQDGECELCERYVKLTRHHLIPRSTWPRIKPRLIQAAPHFFDGDMKMVMKVLNFNSIPSSLSRSDLQSRSSAKQFLTHYTCNICRLCHKTIHERFDNLELAETRNNVEKLLEDEKIRKFCMWANKQKPRKRY